jgi:hypothetical protein
MPLVAVALALGAAPPASPALPRATADRPDDVVGPQVHVMYVVPSDGSDRARDTDGEIVGSVESWQRWLRGHTGGRGLRLDTFQGQLDVTFFRLVTTDAAAKALPEAAIETELAAAHFDAPKKIYAVYYDGGSTAACGFGSTRYPAEFLLGSDSRNGSTCAGQPIGLSPPGYLDFAMLHEIVHGLGYVPPCAPHALPNLHVGDSPLDLMWGGGGPWADLAQMQLDVGHDDYFEAFLPGCPDLSGSRFFEGGGAALDLDVSNEGAAAGDVVVTADGRLPTTCSGGACPTYYDTWPSPTVTLTAEIHSVTERFVGWRGACEGDAFTCTVTMESSKQVGATFVMRSPVPLRVAVSGSGRVRSVPGAISCPRRCSATFAYETRVDLRARPARGWRFAGWRGADECTGRAAACAIVVTDPVSLRATFARRRHAGR